MISKSGEIMLILPKNMGQEEDKGDQKNNIK
jgi:hypothetical protein